MTIISIYTRPMCPYCTRAKQLLDDKQVEYQELDAFMDANNRKDMLARSNGGRTYPQIFIGDTHVGGCDDLMALENTGELDKLLGR